MRASRAVVTGEGKLDEQTLEGKLVGEIGTRARQAGVPLHAIVGTDALDPFGKRIIDLQRTIEATDLRGAGSGRRGPRQRTGRGPRVSRLDQRNCVCAFSVRTLSGRACDLAARRA